MNEVKVRNFQSNFWGEKDNGLDALMSRMRDSKHTCEEVHAFFKERANIEEEYAKKLAKLSKSFNTKSEVGTMKDGLEMLKSELENSARSHADVSAEIRVNLEKPMHEFICTQSNIRKNHHVSIEKLLKQKQALTASVTKTKKNYESKCQESQSLIQQKSAVTIPKDLEKLQAKIDKVSGLANQADFDYIAGVEKLEGVFEKFEHDFKAACADCQKLEEDRIDFLRSHIWDYTNLLSTVCVSDDESLEKIRVVLEKCDIEKDIQIALDKYSTGTEIPQPMKYVNFYNGLTHRQSMATEYMAKNATKSSSISSVQETMYGPILGGPGVGPNTASERGNVIKQQPVVAENADDSFFQYDPYSVDNLKIIFNARVLYDYKSQAIEELDIKKGEVLPVFATHDDGWWEAVVDDGERKRKGLFPSNFVQKI